ncbi:BTAD domain-containing putative transcriptional regulator [Streptomyces sp. NBC_00258]|uniref:BTAD domain-containing putative transcriptional regulator n=1 Tax=Streptomyces sp. NBC_00258 TaxID=2903642 RepID=UPI002E2D8A67|nr:BTAD domain-containing putative transcriptional regulator [Streptomyces sp. NBC_00258]
MRSGLRFGLLGPTVVYDADGVPRPVSSAKGRVLLTSLLLEPGRVVSVDVLKDALWGGTPPASAHASLQNHVTRLRRLLDDPDRLRSVPPGYQLRVSEGELDVRLFETRIGAAREAHARRDWERAVAEAVAALGLWRGTPLTGMPPGLGGLSLVQRLEEARLFALECRYEAELELGRGMSDGDVRLFGLAPELAALVAEFPLREAFHRQLMMVLYRTGRRAEALAVHRDLRRTLVRELGVEPGLTVREAHLEILRDQDPGAGAGVGGGSEAGSGSRSGPTAGPGPGPGSGSGSGTDASAGVGTGAAEAAASSRTGAPAEAVGPAGRQPTGGDGVSAPKPAKSASSRTDRRGADRPPSTEASPAAPAAPKVPTLVPVPRPAQLPPAPVCFTGRAETIDSLRATLVPVGAGHLRVAVVSGMAGVGKSALGVQAAHGLRAEFPDGQLYVRLHGATPGVPPLTVGQALAALLRDLGVEPRGVPEHPDAASALLRSLLAPTRTLLVLDDAVNAAQVRPLLPAGPGCAVIVTSRSPLTALDGVTRFPLAPLSDEESAELLRAVSGRDGLDGTHPLVGLTGRLPLALRIVAARLAARKVLTPDALAGQLAASDGRLNHLEYDDLSVRRSLAVALDALRASDREADRDAALALRRIGALDLPTYGVPLLARLLGTGERRTEAALDRLVDVALLDETTYGRYTPHDLVRDFAREVAREVARETAEGEDPGPTDLDLTDSDPTGAGSTGAGSTGSGSSGSSFTDSSSSGSGSEDPDPTDIALRWYVASARRCVPALIPTGVDRDNRLGATPVESERAGAGGDEAVPFASAAEAVAWGDREVANVVALVEGRAADSPLVPVLVRALFPYLQRRGRLRELAVLGRRALNVARRLGDDAAEAIALSDLAGLYFMQGQAGKALVLTDQALTRWRGLGVVSRIQRCLNNRGLLLESLGRYVECELALRESLELARESGDLDGEAVAYSNLGNLYEHSDPSVAIEWHERSLALGESMGDSRVRESGHCNIGYAHLTLGEPARALEHFDRALSVSDGVDWQSGSQTRLGLVRALRGLDRTERAARECALLLARAEQRADRYTAGLARHQQGLLHRSAGRTDEAYEQWELALDDLDGTDSTVTDELRELLLVQLNNPSVRGS